MFSRNGMSMVEIMIGVILLTLIIIPSLNVITSKTSSVTSTRDHAQAAFLAQKIQEIARAFRFDLIEADHLASNPTEQKKTFEWKIKNLEEFNKYSFNSIDYFVEDIKVDTVLNKEISATNQIPLLNLISFTIKYTGKDKKNHQLDINTAISMRD